MSKIKIFGDSACDLPKDILDRYDMETMALPVFIGDEMRMDGVDITPDDIYHYYNTTGKLCKTTAANQMDYQNFWKPWLEQGYEIIHFIHSSDTSTTYNCAKLAAENVEHVYPIDSRVVSTGIGLLMIEACELREQGKSTREIVDTMNEIKMKHQTSFLVDVIEYLWKGGRCSSLAALGSNVLKIKPRLDLVDGKIVATKKYRGSTEKCFENYAIDLLKDRTDIKLDRIFVTHSGIDQKIIDIVIEKIREYQPQVKEIIVLRTGATISCHCGPGTLGIVYRYK